MFALKQAFVGHIPIFHQSINANALRKLSLTTEMNNNCKRLRRSAEIEENINSRMRGNSYDRHFYRPSCLTKRIFQRTWSEMDPLTNRRKRQEDGVENVLSNTQGSVDNQWVSMRRRFVISKVGRHHKKRRMCASTYMPELTTNSRDNKLKCRECERRGCHWE